MTAPTGDAMARDVRRYTRRLGRAAMTAPTGNEGIGEYAIAPLSR